MTYMSGSDLHQLYTDIKVKARKRILIIDNNFEMYVLNMTTHQSKRGNRLKVIITRQAYYLLIHQRMKSAIVKLPLTILAVIKKIRNIKHYRFNEYGCKHQCQPSESNHLHSFQSSHIAMQSLHNSIY